MSDQNDTVKVRQFSINVGGEQAQAIYDVLAERVRQVDHEGWSPEYDDQHTLGELAAAAACYCHPEPCMDDMRGVPFSWPWVRLWWKPTDRRRDLVKAGALILAEIERLDRIEREAMVNGNSRRID